MLFNFKLLFFGKEKENIQAEFLALIATELGIIFLLLYFFPQQKGQGRATALRRDHGVPCSPWNVQLGGGLVR